MRIRLRTPTPKDNPNLVSIVIKLSDRAHQPLLKVNITPSWPVASTSTLGKT